MKNNQSFSEKFESVLGPLAMKISQNMYITSIRDAMLAYMPFTFIGSIALIIAFFPVPQVTEFITNLFGSDAWVGYLLYINGATIAIGGLIVVLSMAKSLAEKIDTNILQAILTSLVSFYLLLPLTNIDGVSYLDVSLLSAQSIFLALLTSMLATILYKKIEERGITIKMPDSVPPAVSGPFESVIPSLIVIVVFFAFRVVLEAGFQTDALTVIDKFLGAPLTMVGGSLAGMVFVKVFEQLLWFFGIHGGSIVGAAMDPIHQVLEDQNRVASIAGDLPTNIISLSFKNHFASIGVVGAVIAIVIISKSKRYKEMGKIAMIPYIFNIGEPALFGIPLLLNPTYFIPFVFTNGIVTVIAYSAFALGLVPIPTGLAQLPWTTPLLISGYFVTGSIRGSLLQLVLIAIATLIWIPFIKIEDKKLVEQENQPIDENMETQEV